MQVFVVIIDGIWFLKFFVIAVFYEKVQTIQYLQGATPTVY